MKKAGNAWAVVDFDGINIATVSPTRRAAIVNWLVVEKNVAIMHGTSDEEIEIAWRKRCGDSEAAQVMVTVI